MRAHHIAIALIAASAGAAQAQIYKCPDASGRTVIQQMPCAGATGQKLDVRPASGQAAAPPLAAASGAKPITEAERLNALSDASARNRRKQDLDERIVPRARADMYGHRQECQRKVKELKARQYAYEQNLYGKTHAAQMASEMAAVAAQCDTKDRELTATFTRLLDECKGLSGCAAIVP